jgi:hypothetical protein
MKTVIIQTPSDYVQYARKQLANSSTNYFVLLQKITICSFGRFYVIQWLTLLNHWHGLFLLKTFT